MKFTICLVATCFASTLCAHDSGRVSVLTASHNPRTSTQEVVESVLDAPGGEVLGAEGPILEGPVLQGAQIVPYQTHRIPSSGSIATTESVIIPPAPIHVPGVECTTCCQTKCCCKQRPQKATFCLIDPRGCEHEACVKVPFCCVNEQPIITWKHGVFGRMIATLCWECCDHEVRVIITRRGKVRVRD